jgi:hypothetical protein
MAVVDHTLKLSCFEAWERENDRLGRREALLSTADSDPCRLSRPHDRLSVP